MKSQYNKIKTIALILSFLLLVYKIMTERDWEIIAIVLTLFLALFFSDSIKRIGIGNSYIELKDNINDLRHILAINTKALFALLQRHNRNGGIDEQEKNEIYNEILDLLSNNNFSKDEINKLQEKWHYWVEGDYVRRIVDMTPTASSDANELWVKKRRYFKENANSIKPDDLKKLFHEFDSYKNDVMLYIDDFAYYRENKEHRDFKRWVFLQSGNAFK